MANDRILPTALGTSDYLLPVEQGLVKAPILIVFENFRTTGGIQTLVRLLTDFFLAQGHPTLVLGNFATEIKAMFPQENICDLSDRYDFLGAHHFFRTLNSKDILVLCFSGGGASIALEAIRTHKKFTEPRFLLGVYHPRVFGVDLQKPISSLINSLFARSLDARAVYFMNKECRISNLKYLGKKFFSSQVIPLPVLPEQGNWIPVQRRTKILSVGRLTEFKAYNFCAARIARNLRTEGVDIEWDIYGHGEEVSRLEKSLKGSNNVWFKGEVALSDYASTCLKYDLFIGMGTAAVQAASLGLPTLLAIDNEGELTHGYACNAPYGNVGERTDEKTPILLSHAIAKYVRAEIGERERLSAQCKKWSEQYSPELLLPVILNKLNSSPRVALDNTLFARLFWSGLALKQFARSKTTL